MQHDPLCFYAGIPWHEGDDDCSICMVIREAERRGMDKTLAALKACI